MDGKHIFMENKPQFNKIAMVLLFIISLIGIFFTFIFAVATGKEGFYFSDLGNLAIIVSVYSIIIITWIFLSRRYRNPLVSTFAFAVILLSFFPLSLSLYTSISLFVKDKQTKKIAAEATVTSYQDNFIQWPGFQYPVGLQVEIGLIAPYVLQKNAGFYYPLLWMGPGLSADARKWYTFASSDNVTIGDKLLPYLSRPNDRRENSNVLQAGQKVTLKYDLLPGVISLYEDSNHFCISPDRSDDRFVYSEGSQLNGTYFYGDADFSEPLLKQIRQHSKLENNPELWKAMHQQFTAENLMKIGYSQCQIRDRKENCFCR